MARQRNREVVEANIRPLPTLPIITDPIYALYRTVRAPKLPPFYKTNKQREAVIRDVLMGAPIRTALLASCINGSIINKIYTDPTFAPVRDELEFAAARFIANICALQYEAIGLLENPAERCKVIDRAIEAFNVPVNGGVGVGQAGGEGSEYTIIAVPLFAVTKEEEHIDDSNKGIMEVTSCQNG